MNSTMHPAIQPNESIISDSCFPRGPHEGEREPWNMERAFRAEVQARGGFTCHHAHFDKAYLINAENLKLSQRDMQEKWRLYRDLKTAYTVADLERRISRGVERMIDQGVTHCRSFIDADALVGLLPLEVACAVREHYRDQIHLEFAVQPLEGVLDPEARSAFVKACERADIVGGLPSRDRPNPRAHLDFILSLARDLDKPVDVHIDQENQPGERETEHERGTDFARGHGRASMDIWPFWVLGSSPVRRDSVELRSEPLEMPGVEVKNCVKV